MKIVTNSTGTKAIGIGSDITALMMNIYQTEEGYVLMVMVSGLTHMDFETDETLEGIQAKATTVIEALGD